MLKCSVAWAVLLHLHGGCVCSSFWLLGVSVGVSKFSPAYWWESVLRLELRI